jgi:hypothetical protein
LEQQAEQAKQRGFDLNEMVDTDIDEPPRASSTLSMHDLELLLTRSEFLPAGIVVKQLQPGEFSYQTPGMQSPVRVTTRPSYFDDHAESVELWSPGGPQFPSPDEVAPASEVSNQTFEALLKA